CRDGRLQAHYGEARCAQSAERQHSDHGPLQYSVPANISTALNIHNFSRLPHECGRRRILLLHFTLEGVRSGPLCFRLPYAYVQRTRGAFQLSRKEWFGKSISAIAGPEIKYEN